MIRFLLGVVVGAVGAAAYLNRQKGDVFGRVDELSMAAHNIVADPSINVGDSTPDRMTQRETIV